MTPKRTTRRICLDRQALAALKADGIGWGHDLDCGCLRLEVPPTRRRWGRGRR